MREILLEGKPIERGEHYGEEFADKIREEVYLLRGTGLCTCSIKNNSPNEINFLLKRFQYNLAKYLPSVLEEIEGISMAANLELDDILLLNMAPTFGSGCCSQVVFKNTRFGRMHIKTSDIGLGEKDLYLLRKIIPEEGYKLIAIGWIGGLWAEAGMNEKGLTIGISSIGGVSSECPSVCIDRFLLTYPILINCATVKEAVSFCKKWSLMRRGVLYMITDNQGNLAVLEKSPDGQEVRVAQADTIFCTNQYEILPLKSLGFPPQSFIDNSAGRAKTLRNLLTGPLGNVKELTIDKVIDDLLSDHSPGGSICQHGQDDVYSQYSYIFLPDLKKLILSDDYACLKNFSEIILPG